ncbi:MAG: hypothetical protein KDD42_02070 [Bdellovibrionales bacterium]|nr:hypothetical protein [Bdellovibrionales bacterium]
MVIKQRIFGKVLLTGLALSILLLEAAVFGNAASAQELTFSKLRKKRDLVLNQCSLVDGQTKAIIVRPGNRVKLPRKANRKPVKLGSRYKYFACGDNGNSEHSIFAKTSEDGEMVEFNLGEEDFEERPDNTGGGNSNGLKAVCPKIRDLERADIYKTRGSDHFSDCRRYTVGLIVAPGGQGISNSCIPVYDSDGTQIYSMGGYYPAGPPWRSRHYGCWGCSSSALGGASLAAKARKNTGSETVYIKAGSQCIRVPDAGRCYNSVSC